ncbi:hypothetical protein NFI96_012567 [Prochilodus magdalenae]|nr:hypothetical protein NFI96_012567 [Prochilodus magdalenae]
MQIFFSCLQACVCHAYQMARANGIPDEQIVVMMYDDISSNKENPHPGEIINEPNGSNVYRGVLKDYTKRDVSVKNFLAVLRGDEAGVTKRPGGPNKVLKSGGNDSIFIYLSGHGGQGVFVFPEEYVSSPCVSTCWHYKRDVKMPTVLKGMFYAVMCNIADGDLCRKLFFGINDRASAKKHTRQVSSWPVTPENMLLFVYGVSASTPLEFSYACYYDHDRCTFLSNEFTSHWISHSEMIKDLFLFKQSDLTRTTFKDQFVHLKTKVRKSTPCQYGNIELSRLFISDILGCSESRPQTLHAGGATSARLSDLTPSHDVPLIIQQNKIRKEKDPVKKRALERDYHKLQQTRRRIGNAVQDITRQAGLERGSRRATERHLLTRLDEMRDVAEHFRRTFSEWHGEQDDCCILSHMHVFVGLIDSGVKAARIKTAITQVHMRKEHYYFST